MRHLFFLFLLLPVAGGAHPGVGIVKDSRGNIYYTDLKQVWRISPHGVRQRAVQGVHTHELYMDPADNLYGEHSWYNGDGAKTWGHYVWCLRSNKKLDTLIKPTGGFLKNYSFTRDKEGTMYWVEHRTLSRFKKKTPEGLITTVAEGKFNDVRWIHVTEDGIIYFIDFHHLYKIDKAPNIQLVAKNITQASSVGLPGGRHSLFGIWTDNSDHVYVADFSGYSVKKIGLDGSIQTAVVSAAPWSPTGGLFDDAGNLWLLETSLSNDARVRKISDSPFGEKKMTVVLLYHYLLAAALGITGLSAIALLSKQLIKKKKASGGLSPFPEK